MNGLFASSISSSNDSEMSQHQQAAMMSTTAMAVVRAIGPPSWKIQDIIRLVILPILFAIGAPLNLAALSHLMSERKTTSTLAARMHLLKLHLNISDLMILFVYTASQICWLITYEWRGGQFLCKIVKFSHTLSFGISSNVVVCIAFDRVASIFESKRRRSDERRKPGLRRVKISLILAWAAAIACALPQFVVWTTYRPFPNLAWAQCVSIFFVHEAAVKRNLTTSPTPLANSNFNLLLNSKTAYAGFHVLAIFWIPALIIAVCYLNVMAWLFCHGRSPRNSIGGGGGGGGDSMGPGGSGGGISGWAYYWRCCLANAVRTRFNSAAAATTDGVGSKCRYSSVASTPQAINNKNNGAAQLAKSSQVGVLVDEGTMTPKSCTVRNDYCYGAVDFLANNDGLGLCNGGTGGPVCLANPTSPKGSGCSSTPLLAAAQADHHHNSSNLNSHRPSATSCANSRTASANNIVVTSAVLDLQRVKRRAMRSSFLVVIAYIATWLPYNVIALWGLIDEKHYKEYGVSVSFLQYLIVLNSVINPFLYGTIGRLRKYVSNS